MYRKSAGKVGRKVFRRIHKTEKEYGMVEFQLLPSHLCLPHSNHILLIALSLGFSLFLRLSLQAGLYALHLEWASFSIDIHKSVRGFHILWQNFQHFLFFL